MRSDLPPPVRLKKGSKTPGHRCAEASTHFLRSQDGSANRFAGQEAHRKIRISLGVVLADDRAGTRVRKRSAKAVLSLEGSRPSAYKLSGGLHCRQFLMFPSSSQVSTEYYPTHAAAPAPGSTQGASYTPRTPVLCSLQATFSLLNQEKASF